MMSIFPTRDALCQLGQRQNAGPGYDIMLVFDARAVEVAVLRSGGALCFNRAGTISASSPIPCGETLAQVIVMGSPPRHRPARHLVVYG